MPKMKTHSGAKKRFRRTGSGKVKHAHAYHRHHAWAKDSKKGQALRETSYFTGGDAKKIDRLLPN